MYMLGIGEIAFMWNGEIVGVRHMRIVPGRKISINSRAQTSWVRDGVLQQGVPGWFQFASLEEGAGAEMILPPPMTLHLTVGFLVRKIIVMAKIFFLRTEHWFFFIKYFIYFYLVTLFFSDIVGYQVWSRVPVRQFSN